MQAAFREKEALARNEQVAAALKATGNVPVTGFAIDKTPASPRQLAEHGIGFSFGDDDDEGKGDGDAAHGGAAASTEKASNGTKPASSASANAEEISLGDDSSSLSE